MMASTSLRLAVLVTLALALGAVAGCTSVQPTLEWKDPAYAGGAIESFLVVGVSEDQAARRRFEDQFVAQLQAKGATAGSSYALLPAGSEPSEEAIDRYLAGGGDAQAIIITHLVGTDEKTVYNPPRWQPVPASYRTYGGYYGHVNSYVYQPGYYSTHEYVKLETNLFRVKDGQLLWTMQSQSVDPASAEKLIDALVGLAVKKLQENGFL